jgi:26S proteasome regulatory subunit N10
VCFQFKFYKFVLILTHPLHTEDQAGGKEEAAKKDVKKEKDIPMEVEGDEDYSEVMNDPEFLQSVLENLPGVDPQSEAIRQAVGSLSKEKKDRKDEDKDKSSRK